MRRSGFTLVELLIAIGLTAALAIATIITLNPAELTRQARDGSRLSDSETIDRAIRLYQLSNSTGFIGSSSYIYVSVPDPAATTSAGTDCSSLSLPSLPAGWTYHCAASSTLRKLDGTGWIPIRFADSPSAASMGAIPVDPVNDTSTRLYYIYAVNGSNWELNMKMQSSKYGRGGTRDVVTADGGDDTSLLEVGSSKTVMPAGAAGLGEGNIDATHSFAWSENIGWIDFYTTQTVTVNSTKLTGYASSSVGEIALDCATSPNGDVCTSSSFGVTNDGDGNLSGWAWNDTTGWISFNCSNDSSCGTSNYSVKISATGTFTGYAWSENIGWIQFNCREDSSCGTIDYKVRTSWTH